MVVCHAASIPHLSRARREGEFLKERCPNVKGKWQCSSSLQVGRVFSEFCLTIRADCELCSQFGVNRDGKTNICRNKDLRRSRSIIPTVDFDYKERRLIVNSRSSS